MGLGEAGMGEGRRAGYQGPKDDGLAITRLQTQACEGMTHDGLPDTRRTLYEREESSTS